MIQIHHRFVEMKLAVTMLVLILGLGGCDLPLAGLAPQEQPEVAVPAGGQTLSETLVEFHVQIPADTPPDQPILFTIMDEVTGLALNSRRYPMEAIDATTYSIKLPLPVGTVVQYRYSRRGEILAEEHTSDGRPVRYRLYLVEGPGEVFDVVARWNDTLYNGATGRIQGRLSDGESGLPLPGLLIAAGGAQVLSQGDGGFLIEGLPPGTHNLVVYALDGSYQTFQQGALVAPGSATPAEIQLAGAPQVEITFLVTLPKDSPPPVIPLRIAGNLYQLGNTFANLSGGVSTLAERMPTLALLPDDTFGIILKLPAGADLRYKYTLGDGFWNAERDAEGAFVVRQLIVPDQPTVIRDVVETWRSGPVQPITFDIHVPENTPAGENISLQLNPFGWMAPLPMWHLGGDRWATILYSPVDRVSQIGYRYCRAGQCGHADDARTPGEFTSGQIAVPGTSELLVSEKVESWAWLESELPEASVTDTRVPRRAPDFVAGVEFQAFYHPSWDARYPQAFDRVHALGANWLVFTPSWTFTRLDPPVFEPVAGQDAHWIDLRKAIQGAQALGFELALRPVPHFPTLADEWWASAPRDFSWWVSWFDRYEAFALHHAELAAQSGMQTLILGGEWMQPAMPGGTLYDGSPSGVPLDAGQRYRALIAKVRERFGGTVAWALVYPQGVQSSYDFLEAVDQIVVLWSAPLQGGAEASQADRIKAASRILDGDIFGLRLTWKPASGDPSILISLLYPSASGVLTGCLSDPIFGCLPPASLNTPAPDYPLLDVDLAAQAKAYDAVLAAINQTDWVDGVISAGYYPPALLHDKSASIHGKPAQDVLHWWYTMFLREK